jgi:hypothetical protein
MLLEMQISWSSFFESKEIEKKEATEIEDTQRLVTEKIEMLKVVLYLVARKRKVRASITNYKQTAK